MKKDLGLSPQLRRLVARLRVVSRRDALTVSILAGSIAVRFIHLKFATQVIDPFVNVSRPMEARWFVYFLGDALGNVLLSWFIWRAVMGKFKVFAWLYLMYCVYDLLLFFWCFNEKSYYYIPYAAMLLVTWKLFKR